MHIIVGACLTTKSGDQLSEIKPILNVFVHDKKSICHLCTLSDFMFDILCLFNILLFAFFLVLFLLCLLFVSLLACSSFVNSPGYASFT